jgi:hypothetical protein
MSNGALKLLAASGAKTVAADLAVVPFEDSGGGVHTIDISDPTNMSILATLASSAAMTKPFGAKLDITNGRAFICCEDDSIAVIDVSNPSSPSITGALAQQDGLKYLDIDPTRDVAYGSVFSNPGGIIAYDVSDPTSPSETGDELSTAYRSSMGIANHRGIDHCFSVDHTAMYCWRVTTGNPAHVSTLSSASLSNAGAIKLDESNNIAFVAANGGIVSVNIANTSSMAILDTAAGTSSGDNYDIAIDLEAGIAFVTIAQYNQYGLMCFDISNPSSISLLDTLKDNTNLIGARGVAYDPGAKVAYVSCGQGAGANSKFTAVSASNTSSLSVLGSVGTSNAPARAAINTTPREATNAEETS